MPYYRCPACGLTSYSAAAYSSAGVCPSCSTRLAEDSRLHVIPGAHGDITRVLAARPEAAGEARRAIVSLPLGEAVRERLALLVSELVTNSVRHAGLSAGDAITLRITTHDGRARIAVRDGGGGFDSEPNTPDGKPAAGDEPGRGLAIVEEVADQWGADRDADGFTVWCEIDVEKAGEAEGQLSEAGEAEGQLTAG